MAMPFYPLIRAIDSETFGKLLRGDTDRRHVGARSAIGLGQPKLQQAHVAELRHQFHRKAVIAVDLVGDRGHLLGDEPLQGVAKRNLIFGAWLCLH
jgi:hypothetical protein